MSKKKVHKWTNRNSKGPSKKPGLSPLVRAEMAKNELAKKVRAKTAKPSKPRVKRVVMKGLRSDTVVKPDPVVTPKITGIREWSWEIKTINGSSEKENPQTGEMEKKFFKTKQLLLKHGEELVFRIVKRREKTGRQIPNPANQAEMVDEYFETKFSISRMYLEAQEVDDSHFIKPLKGLEIPPKVKSHPKFMKELEPGTWLQEESNLTKVQAIAWLKQFIGGDAVQAVGSLDPVK